MKPKLLHDQMLKEIYDRKFLNNKLSEKELVEQRILLEQFEFQNQLRMDEEELDQKVLEGLLKLKQNEEAEKSLAKSFRLRRRM